MQLFEANCTKLSATLLNVTRISLVASSSKCDIQLLLCVAGITRKLEERPPRRSFSCNRLNYRIETNRNSQTLIQVEIEYREDVVGSKSNFSNDFATAISYYISIMVISIM